MIIRQSDNDCSTDLRYLTAKPKPPCVKLLRMTGDHSNSLHSFVLLGRGKDSGFSTEDVAEGPAPVSLLVETGDWTEGDWLDSKRFAVRNDGLVCYQIANVSDVSAGRESHYWNLHPRQPIFILYLKSTLTSTKRATLPQSQRGSSRILQQVCSWHKIYTPICVWLRELQPKGKEITL